MAQQIVARNPLGALRLLTIVCCLAGRQLPAARGSPLQLEPTQTADDDGLAPEALGAVSLRARLLAAQQGPQIQLHRQQSRVPRSQRALLPSALAVEDFGPRRSPPTDRQDLVALPHRDKELRAYLQSLIESSLERSLSDMTKRFNSMAAAGSVGEPYMDDVIGEGRPTGPGHQSERRSASASAASSSPSASPYLSGDGSASDGSAPPPATSQLDGSPSVSPEDIYMARLTELQQTPEPLAAGYSLRPLQYLPPVVPASAPDKREYIRPCSFNAVSCAKAQFKKI